MDDKANLIKYFCEDCGLSFWADPGDEPRFCPFCERALFKPAK